MTGSDIYLADLEMLERCDAVLLSWYWKQSRGANLEAAWARYKGLPTFESFKELEEWLDKV